MVSLIEQMSTDSRRLEHRIVFQKKPNFIHQPNVGETRNGVAKEAKSSAGGYKPVQHDTQKMLVEGSQAIFGKGIRVHLTVPSAEAAGLEATNPELEDRVQGH